MRWGTLKVKTLNPKDLLLRGKEGQVAHLLRGEDGEVAHLLRGEERELWHLCLHAALEGLGILHRRVLHALPRILLGAGRKDGAVAGGQGAQAGLQGGRGPGGRGGEGKIGGDRAGGGGGRGGLGVCCLP